MVLWVYGSAGSTFAADPRFSEAGLKAAYLLNFASFVEWPTNRAGRGDSTLVIGVLGRPDVAATLRELVQRKATGAGRTRTVRELKSAEEAVDCHIVYAGAEADGDGVLRVVAGRPVLTVGDAEGYADRGGCVEFSLADERIRFDVNQRVAEAVGLKISSKVLSLARRVVRGGAAGP